MIVKYDFNEYLQAGATENTKLTSISGFSNIINTIK